MSCSYYTFRQGDYYCTKKQDYVNSDVYYKYCRNYDYRDCPIYKTETSSGGCYLTSACVAARGLPDDCHELETLRDFRDNWLRKQEGGEEAIQEYYRVAPGIVTAINERADTKEIWKWVYQELVAPSVELVEQGRMEAAYEYYVQITAKIQCMCKK